MQPRHWLPLAAIGCHWPAFGKACKGDVGWARCGDSKPRRRKSAGGMRGSGAAGPAGPTSNNPSSPWPSRIGPDRDRREPIGQPRPVCMPWLRWSHAGLIRAASPRRGRAATTRSPGVREVGRAGRAHPAEGRGFDSWWLGVAWRGLPSRALPCRAARRRLVFTSPRTGSGISATPYPRASGCSRVRPCTGAGDIPRVTLFATHAAKRVVLFVVPLAAAKHGCPSGSEEPVAFVLCTVAL